MLGETKEKSFLPDDWLLKFAVQVNQWVFLQRAIEKRSSHWLDPAFYTDDPAPKEESNRGANLAAVGEEGQAKNDQESRNVKKVKAVVGKDKINA